MMKSEIRSDADMVDYLVDCTLATVEDFLNPKTIRKGEFRRQCNIAQTGIDWLGPDHDWDTNRARRVVENGGNVFAYYSARRQKRQSAKEAKA